MVVLNGCASEINGDQPTDGGNAGSGSVTSTKQDLTQAYNYNNSFKQYAVGDDPMDDALRCWGESFYPQSYYDYQYIAKGQEYLLRDINGYTNLQIDTWATVNIAGIQWQEAWIEQSPSPGKPATKWSAFTRYKIGSHVIDGTQFYYYSDYQMKNQIGHCSIGNDDPLNPSNFGMFASLGRTY